MGRLLGGFPRRAARSQVRHVVPVPPASARGLVATVYAQVERDFGLLAPPIALHSPAPGPLAAAWLMLREALLAAGLVRRAVKEAVAVAVSRLNACRYCVDMHSAALHGLGWERDAIALADGGTGGDDLHEDIHQMVGWAAASGRRRQAVAARLPAPAAHAPELIGAVVTSHYLNRMVNLFVAGSLIPPWLPAAARRSARRMAGRSLRPALRRPVAPGGAQELLPAAPLPADMSWAAGNEAVAEAFARAAATIDDAGRRSVPAPVRELVTARLAGWDGEPPGVLRDWAFDAVAVLPRGDRPAGHLALLAAFAPDQAGEPAFAGFRRHYRPDDQSLIEVASWASMAAARAHGDWLWRTRDSTAEQASRRSWDLALGEE